MAARGGQTVLAHVQNQWYHELLYLVMQQIWNAVAFVGTRRCGYERAHRGAAAEGGGRDAGRHGNGKIRTPPAPTHRFTAAAAAAISTATTAVTVTDHHKFEGRLGADTGVDGTGRRTKNERVAHHGH